MNTNYFAFVLSQHSSEPAVSNGVDKPLDFRWIAEASAILIAFESQVRNSAEWHW